MLLSSTTESIQISKAAGVTTTAPEVYAAYVDITTTTMSPGVQRTQLSSGTGTDDTVVNSPSASTSRQVKYLTIFNRDTVAQTFSVQHQDTTTDYFIAQMVLQPNEMAEFVWQKGWTVYDTQGFARTNTGAFMSAWSASGSAATSGQLSLSDAQGVFFRLNTQTITARAVPNMNSSFWANLDAHGTTMSTLSNTVASSLMVFPINPQGDLRFPGVMTVSSMYIGMSGSQNVTNASSTSAAFTWSFGLYTLNGSTLSLLNSGTATASIASGSDCTSGLHGPRFFSVATGGWSSSLVLSNVPYFLGIVQATAGQTKSLAYLGWRYLGTDQWSGFLGQQTSSATSRGMYPFAGVMATGDIPTTIQVSQLDHANASAGFVPYLVFNNFSNLL